MGALVQTSFIRYGGWDTNTGFYSSKRIRSSSSMSKDRECVLAIDVGTGGTKAALISCKGRVLTSGFCSHPPPTPSSIGGAQSLEQDQTIWWLATVEAVKTCMSPVQMENKGIHTDHIRALVITGQMQDVVIIPKKNCEFKLHSILYSDTRAASEANEIAELAGSASQLTKITGSLQGASSVLAKLRWIDKHIPHAVQCCERLLFGGHDYVCWRLCGSYVTDTTTASTTGLTSTEFGYAENLLQKVNLGHWIEKLPQILPSDVPVGEVSDIASEELGCAALQGVPVIHCCGDAGSCSIGAGAAEPGSTYAYLGTSGWVAGSFPVSNTKHAETQPGVFTLGHPDKSLVFRTGSIMTAGGNLSWAATNFHCDTTDALPFDRIDEMVASTNLGSDGLIYLPFLNGERCPVDKPNLRAALIGISATTTSSDMFRAVMEGVAFGMRSAREAMTGQQLDELDVANEGKGRRLRLVGGGARSHLWASIMGGVFGEAVDVLEHAQDVGVKGAAVVAGKWLGWHDSFSPSLGQWLMVKHSYEPTCGDVEAYQKLYRIYTRAWNNLMDVCEEVRVYR